MVDGTGRTREYTIVARNSATEDTSQPVGRRTDEPFSIRVRRHAIELVKARRKLLLFVLTLVVCLVVERSNNGAHAGNHRASLRAALAKEELDVNASSIVWIPHDTSPLALRPVIFVARSTSERSSLPDLYYAEARPSDNGAILDVAWITNLTRTSSASEESPIRIGHHLLYASKVGDVFDAVVLVDLRGEPRALTRDWPPRARLQNRVTNLQETGRMRGFGKRRYALRQPATRLRIHAREGRFSVDTDHGRIVIDPYRVQPIQGAEQVEARPSGKGQPGTISWIVDTVRNLSFVGPEPIEWLEHRVFGVKDLAERKWHDWFGSDDTREEVVEELGVTEAERRRRVALAPNTPELGWPPPPLEPMLTPRIEGEGEWIPVVDDPYLKTYANAPPAFYQTFIRSDSERAFTRVYVMMWDPRQVQLNIMTGTREPESATGETGPGMVPRDPEVLTRLVAAFNGGFQALHGEFGMMAEGRVYIPPKPWAATIAVFDDGRAALGSWLAPPSEAEDYQESWATQQIPSHIVAFRQNLTSVVEDGRYNPWRRWWWGAAPLNAAEQTFIDRSGLCLTKEGFMAYFWGQSLGPEALGAAMLATRCVRGMHLDMNSKHTGFEFYNVTRADEAREPLSRPLGEYRYEGPVPGVDGLVARSRLAVRSMAPMAFPRYLARDARDFFYLTLRPVLPGPALDVSNPATQGASPGEGQFSTEGLPHAGWPLSFAQTFLGKSASEGTIVVRIDRYRAVPGPVAGGALTRPLAYFSNAKIAEGAEPTGEGQVALYAARILIGWRYAVGAPPASARVLVSGEILGPESTAGAAIGVDREGFLVYAERAGDGVPLSVRMREAGVETAVELPENIRLSFVVGDQLVGPDAYERPADIEAAMPLMAEERPRTEVLFPDVRPRPYGVWARMQDTRVRYFREGPARFQMPAVDAGQVER